ncbi:MAG: hypothetical protein R2828_22345 [Saprospiraceae bacterium]
MMRYLLQVKKVLLPLLFCGVFNSGWASGLGWAKVFEPLRYVQLTLLHDSSLDVVIDQRHSLEVFQSKDKDGGIKNRHFHLLELIGKPYLLESLKEKREVEEIFAPLNIVVDDVIVMVHDMPDRGDFKSPLLRYRSPG